MPTSSSQRFAHDADANAGASIAGSGEPISRPLEIKTRPMEIKILPCGVACWEFVGSRAQLQAEGVIPTDAQWPEGLDTYEWESASLKFSLRRTKPSDLKGPRKVWAGVDWWVLRGSHKGAPPFAIREIQRKRRELEAAMYRETLEGRREASVLWHRYWQAREDKAFQVFKAKVLPQGIKPGPKPKGTANGEPAAR